MKDISSLGNSTYKANIQSDVDELAKEVLINNESYDKFRKLYIAKMQAASINKDDFENNFNQFINSFQKFSASRKFSQSAKTALIGMGNEAFISQSKVNEIIIHYEKKWEHERIEEENEEQEKQKRNRIRQERINKENDIQLQKEEKLRKKQAKIYWWHNNKRTIGIIGIIIAGIGVASGLAYVIYEYWETILTIVAVIVFLGILSLFVRD